MSKDTSIPAFPLHNHGAQTLGMHLTGMTLRDYFAAKAMQALIQARTTLKEEDYPDDSYTFVVNFGLGSETELGKEGGGKYRWGELLAEESYEMADEMLKARSK